MQLSNSKYGIAYTDATEKVTQLNTAANNNMMEQVTWLTKQVYSALGITESVFDGTATEATMIHSALMCSPRRSATTPRQDAPSIPSSIQGMCFKIPSLFIEVSLVQICKMSELTRL